ncbi:MAG TPA: hypothetical protein VIZ28_01790 [Chitinophagaceae bacterium]
MSEEKNIPEGDPKEQISNSNKENVKEHFPEDSHAPKPATSNQQQETNTMEVHHHGHVHHQKKWKEYLFQFFMLFLAVFCGFLAEYQLEHKIENDREKQFIRSLINDIAADTSRLNNIIGVRNRREQRLDSLSFLLNNQPQQTGDIYYHAISVTRRISLRFVPNDGTLQQLKNAGGLRLIRKRKVADSIASYDVGLRNLVRQVETEEELMQSYSEAAAKILDALVFDKMLDQNNNVIRPTDNPDLAPFTPGDLREFNFKLYPVKSINKSARREERIFLSQAENLLVLLKKEYHLE